MVAALAPQSFAGGDVSGQQPGASSSSSPVWQTIPDDAWADQPADDRDDHECRNQHSKKKDKKNGAQQDDTSKDTGSLKSNKLTKEQLAEIGRFKDN